MTRLFALWTKETLALVRDRHGLAALFAMPAIFILVMTMALHDAFTPGRPVSVGYAIVDLDHSPHARGLATRMDQPSGFRRQPSPADPEAALAAIRAGTLRVALVVPAGFGKRLLAPAGADGEPSPPLTVYIDPTLSPALQLAFQSQLSAALGALRADELTRRAGALFGLPPLAEAASPAREWREAIDTIAVRKAATGKPTTSVQQNVPAWLIFAMFFVITPLSSIFIIERQQGTLQRLQSMGVPFGTVLAGKLLPYFVVNQVQAAAMVGVGLWVVPLLGGEALVMPAGTALARWWLVAAIASLAATAWALLVASLARTPEQAGVIGGVSNILMGALGGVMVPRFVMPAGMQRLADFSPMGWGLDAFHTIMLRDGTLTDIARPLALLAGFALASFLAALALNRPRTA